MIRQTGERVDPTIIDKDTALNLLDLIRILDDPTSKFYLKLDHFTPIDENERVVDKRFMNQIRANLKSIYFKSS